MGKHGRQPQNSARIIPRWQRSHTDWRFLLGVVVMLAAIMLYVASENLSWQP